MMEAPRLATSTAERHGHQQEAGMAAGEQRKDG